MPSKEMESFLGSAALLHSVPLENFISSDVSSLASSPAGGETVTVGFSFVEKDSSAGERTCSAALSPSQKLELQRAAGPEKKIKVLIYQRNIFL